jgi:hypothetical protein
MKTINLLSMTKVERLEVLVELGEMALTEATLRKLEAEREVEHWEDRLRERRAVLAAMKRSPA